jgi:hypothetical protein
MSSRCEFRAAPSSRSPWDMAPESVVICIATSASTASPATNFRRRIRHPLKLLPPSGPPGKAPETRTGVIAAAFVRDRMAAYGESSRRRGHAVVSLTDPIRTSPVHRSIRDNIDSCVGAVSNGRPNVAAVPPVPRFAALMIGRSISSNHHLDEDRLLRGECVT